MLICFTKKKPSVLKQEGFAILGILMVILGITTVILFTVNTVTSEAKLVEKMGLRSGAVVLFERIKSKLSDPDILKNLKNQAKLSDLSVAHAPAYSKSLTCILDFQSGGTTPCDHIAIPSPITGDCSGFPTVESEKACWIAGNLAQHRAFVLFPADPLRRAATDLIVDNRTPTGGLTSNFFTCRSFNIIAGGVVGTCPFRLELYAWVECDGGQPKCGGSSAVDGELKLAAMLRFEDKVGSLSFSDFSIVDIMVVDTIL